jgi:hypothetical protein
MVPGETQLDTPNKNTSAKVERIGYEIDNLFMLHPAFHESSIAIIKKQDSEETLPLNPVLR